MGCCFEFLHSIMGCTSSRLNSEGTYDPSSLTIMLATESKTTYQKQDYPTKYEGNRRVLVVCTDEGQMAMKNGKKFNSGNHPIEMLLPMMHLRDAGFKFDVATSSGGRVVLEMWAFPTKDANVKAFYDEVKGDLEHPKKVSDITSLDDYVAVFIPGGHGCMMNLPENVALGSLLHIAHQKQMPTITLCHGPAALLASGTGDKEFLYKGYKTMCFTDKTDAFTPKVGYLPGEMPWQVQASIEGKGMEVLNKKETGAVNVDRELITGDSPNAADNLGRCAAPLVLNYTVAHKL